MKELVLKKRMELEEVCRHAHLEANPNTAEDKLVGLIESGLVDAADLLTSIVSEINIAKQEVVSRKDIMILTEKWMSACEEEGWLEDYNKVAYNPLIYCNFCFLRFMRADGHETYAG